MESQPFDKQAARSRKNLRREKVTLDCGDVWVREMTCAEAMQLGERAARPAVDPRGGLDPGESVLWQILLSCYEDDSDDASRLFTEAPDDVRIIYGLRLEEFNELMQAVNRVNGRDASEVELLRDFTAAREAAPTSR